MLVSGDGCRSVGPVSVTPTKAAVDVLTRGPSLLAGRRQSQRRHLALPIDDLPREKVDHLRVIARGGQIRRAQHLFLGLAQGIVNLVPNGRIAELSLAGWLAFQEQDERVRAAGGDRLYRSGLGSKHRLAQRRGDSVQRRRRDETPTPSPRWPAL